MRPRPLPLGLSLREAHCSTRQSSHRTSRRGVQVQPKRKSPLLPLLKKYDGQRRTINLEKVLRVKVTARTWKVAKKLEELLRSRANMLK